MNQIKIPAVRLEHISYQYSADTPQVLHDVSLSVPDGSLMALLGPNGSGKTTLIRIATGIVKPTAGRVMLREKPLQRLSRKEVAKRMAVVPQQLYVPFAFNVWEMVAMGRTPHLHGMAPLGVKDRAAIEAALDATDTRYLADRLFTRLSGGERQRVVIAMALAQEPEIMLLDEPTTHLDLEHQIEILELLRRLNRERNLTVLAVTHDLNMAALYFDRMVLLKGGKLIADGTPEQVLTGVTIRQVFHTGVTIMQHPTSQRPYIVVIPEADVHAPKVTDKQSV